MIQSHLIELRSVVEQASDLPEATRAKLLQLTAELEHDVQSNEGIPAGAATGASATSADSETDLESESSRSTGLISAIEGIENSHPEVTATVSNVARMLSKLGF